MELKDIYKDGKSTIYKNGTKTKILNDPGRFELYKALELDVFKPVKNTRKKKDVLSNEE